MPDLSSMIKTRRQRVQQLERLIDVGSWQPQERKLEATRIA